MHAYLFSAGVTCSQYRLELRGHKTLQSWDTCATAIILGDDVDDAHKRFEEWCSGPSGDESPAQTEIKKIVAVELIDQLITESGERPLNWPEISERLIESAPGVDSETGGVTMAEDPGYWVDVNEAVPPQSAHVDVESLKRGLRADIGSALNWSTDKKFIFTASSLSAPPAVTDPYEHLDETDSDETAQQSGDEAGPVLDEAVTQLPEMRDKEAAALVEARNSVIAGWLWRKFTADTPFAANEILVSQCCEIIRTS